MPPRVVPGCAGPHKPLQALNVCRPILSGTRDIAHLCDSGSTCRSALSFTNVSDHILGPPKTLIFAWCFTDMLVCKLFHLLRTLHKAKS